MKKLYTLIFLFILVVENFPQSEYEFFPTGLNVQPFVANTLEPRMGVLFKSKGGELRLDIGNTMDIIKLTQPFGVITVGADFFTWSLLRKEANFRFPVNTVDYLFGINFTLKKKAHDYSAGARLRISHISAHSVDGQFDKTKFVWIDGMVPRVYSREFIEGIVFYQFKNFRVYGGLTYIFHVIPNIDHRDNFQVGFDYFRKNFIYDYLSPFVAYDFKIVDGIKQNPNNSFSIGVKFGSPEGKGVSLYYHYYAGKSIHGPYYDYREKYSGIGINLDL